MSNAVSIRESQMTFTPEQEKLIRDTIARNADANEFKLFLYRCQNMGLDPLKPGLIHFVKYGNGPGTIVVGIDGIRAQAHRTGLVAGISRGVNRDEKGKVIGAWCEVRRKDWHGPAREEVSLSEYDTGKGPWAKMPETMIKKVAEAAALRMAFPESLSGLYSEEEMDQAKEKESEPAYVESSQWIPHGNFKHRTCEQVGEVALREYLKKKKSSPKELTPNDLETIAFIEKWLTKQAPDLIESKPESSGEFDSFQGGDMFAPKTRFRQEIALDISTERKRLMMDKEELGRFIIDKTGKSPTELTDEEMETVLHLMKKVKA